MIKQSIVLIDFDKKTRIFLVACVILFFLLIIFKIHGSSIALWHSKATKAKLHAYGLLAGTPKMIRIDEWSRNTPFILSQYSQDFPKSNPSFGAGNNALANNMPVKDITTFFRPVYWGFFLFDVERGYAWYWNFRTCGLLVSFFLMLMLLTKNNFWLSAFGSLWVLCSSATQWWHSAMVPEIIMYAGFVFVSVVYLLFSDNWRVILLNMILFVIFSFSFISVLYPPWQITAGYLLVILLAGYFITNPIKKIISEKKIGLRIGLVSGGVFILAVLTTYFYFDIKEYIAILQATVYPGERKFEGGEMTVERLFSGYSLFFLNESSVPPEWSNICEASGYILFFPAVVIGMFISFFRGIKIPIILWLLCGYILVLTVWTLFGIPPLLSKIMLLDKVSEVRASVFIGIANIVLVVLFLNESTKLLSGLTSTLKVLLLFGVMACIYFLMEKANAIYIEKIVSWKLIGLAAYFTLMHFCLFTEWKWGKKLFVLAFVPLLLPNLLINPISSGLDPILKHPFYIFIKERKEKYKEGRWMMFGAQSAIVTNLLKANGVPVFGGAIVAPNLKEMEILDEEKNFVSVYNRYIDQFNIESGNSESKPEFKLAFADAVDLRIDPCAEELKNLNVRYILFLYNPSEEETRCMRLLEEAHPFQIFSYNDTAVTDIQKGKQ